MCIWCWWFHWGEDGNHTLSHPPPPCDRRYFLPVTEKPHEAHAMHCEAAGRFTVKGHKQLKGSHSRFTLIFSRRETWKCESVSIQTAGLPFTQRHTVFSWEDQPPARSTNQRGLFPTDRYAMGLYRQSRALLTCPVTLGMWSEFSEGQEEFWDWHSVRFRLAQQHGWTCRNC